MLKQFLLVAILGTLLVATACAKPANVAKVSVLSSGRILLNGREVDLPGVEAEFKRLKQTKGTVWYYREEAQTEPTRDAMAIIRLVVDNKLPVRLSARPDFSDWVDDQGDSRPR